VDALLAKLRSVDLLTEEEYEAALADDLAVNTGPDPTTSGRDPDGPIPSDGPPSQPRDREPPAVWQSHDR
jgi:hypothetical protein